MIVSMELLAGYDPRVELLGVSTVAGNQTCNKTTHNAVKVLAAAGLGHIGITPQDSLLCLLCFGMT
jgi:inosine-uridine nucleoside N-ribohydrolase